MVKIDLNFVCPICRNKYRNFWNARRCEKKRITDLEKYPVGLMQSYTHHSVFGILTIATAKQYSDNKHLGVVNYWACRNIGDTLGDEKCGGDFVDNDLEHFKKWNHLKSEFKETPEFKRMVDFLVSQGIRPSYYDEEGTLHLVYI